MQLLTLKLCFSYTVPKKEVTEFTREMGTRVESNVLAEAVEKAIKYLDEDELPIHWEKNSLFNTQHQYTDSEENFTDVCIAKLPSLIIELIYLV